MPAVARVAPLSFVPEEMGVSVSSWHTPGWALSEMALVYPGKVRAFMEAHKAQMSGVAFSVATEHFSAEERRELLAWRKAHSQQVRRGSTTMPEHARVKAR